MVIDLAALTQAVRGTRENTSDMVTVRLNSITYAFWRAELNEFQREDARVKYAIDPFLKNGWISTALADVPGSPVKMFRLVLEVEV